MVTFKKKTSKTLQANEKNILTLDIKHSQIIEDFYINDTLKIPKLIEYIKYINLILDFINNNTSSLDKSSDFEFKLETFIKENIENATILKFINNTSHQDRNFIIHRIENKIKLYKKKIKDLKNEKINYMISNSNYIFDYFENKKNISDDSKIKENLKQQLIYKFFNMETTSTVDIKQNDIIEKYFMNVNSSSLDINNYISDNDVCTYCNKGELIHMEDDGMLLCNHCFTNTVYLMENEKNSYKDPPKETCCYIYKRINHFKEILSQFQGKETTHIPDKIIDDIKNQIKKERLNNSELNFWKMKEILKKLNYNSKYYEHITYIKIKLGIDAVIFTPTLEEKLCSKFLQLQAPYLQCCPNDRINFLNYYYTLYKLCELEKQVKYLSSIPLLKDKDKLREQDQIWKKMCNILNWEYIPTV